LRSGFAAGVDACLAVLLVSSARRLKARARLSSGDKGATIAGVRLDRECLWRPVSLEVIIAKGREQMPTITCPGDAPISGAGKTVFSANNIPAVKAGALAQMPNDANRDAEAAEKQYTCIPTPECRNCKRGHDPAVAVANGPPKVTHWSLANVLSRIFGGNADYTATQDYTWTSKVRCWCND